MADAKTEQEPSIEEILSSIRHIISDDGDAGANAAAGKGQNAVQPALKAAAPFLPPSAARVSPAPAAVAPKADILELTEKINSGSELELVDKPATTEKPVTMEKTMTDNPNGLMSAQTADAATEALSKLLAGSLVIEKEETARNGKVTLEDLTLDLMKPLLKAWLDQNLPGLIEKIVQKEVEKLSRRALDR